MTAREKNRIRMENPGYVVLVQTPLYESAWWQDERFHGSRNRQEALSQE